MARTAFVTGGAGFIGSRLAKAVAGDFDTIVIFDNLHPQVHGDNASPPPLPDNAVFIRGDVTDKRALEEAVAKHAPDVVFHLAAETGTGQSYDEPSRYNAVNTMGTAYLIEAVRNLPTDISRRVILAGSRAVYGEGAYKDPDGKIVVGPERASEDMAAGKFDPRDSSGRTLSPVPTQEQLPPDPASVYASTKLMQEYLLQQCGATGAFETVLLRFQNVYGPGQSLKNPYTGVLSIFSGQILDGKSLNIYEDGEIVRDFVYVDDVVASLAAASRVKEAPVGPINIGSGYPATILECARTLLELLGRSPDDYTITGDFRPGDIRHAVADITRARDLLNWAPATDLRAGLSALAEWVKAERGG